MKFSTFLFAFAASAIAAPTELSSVAHERRYGHPGLRRGPRVEGNSITSFRIALKQGNIENADDYLMSVSHPSSPKYGKLWTAEEVRKTFSPSVESVDVVKTWLTDSGITNVKESKGWLVFDTEVAHIERLMQTEYHEHEDLSTGAIRLGCDIYHLPEHISKHVDYVAPGIALSPPLEKKSISRRWQHPHHHGPHHPYPHHRPWRHHNPTHHHAPGSDSLPPELRNCGEKITPDCLRALYGLPTAEEVASSYNSDPINSVGVFEDGSVYIPRDLDKFFKKFAPNVPVGTRPTLESIEDAMLTLNRTTRFLAGEANIDLDIIYSLTYPQTITLYQVLQTYDGHLETKGYGLVTAIGNLLDAIDGSFCTDEDKAAGQDCGIYSPTRVISISYGASELYYPEAQQKRQCNEILKLGLQGHTFTVASGDYGVADRPSFNYNTNGCAIPGDYNATVKLFGPSLNGTVFNPPFPQNCPYVLSVGGTQLNADQTVLDSEVALYQPYLLEYNISGIPNPPSVFSTSGGFSNYFSRPSYQQSTVNAYYSSHDPGYPYYNFNGQDFSLPGSNIGANGGLYNRGGRGFPDVSANGAHLQYYMMGTLDENYGTSLSAPIWASIVTLINEKRAEQGKGPVGFINPVLYEHPELMNDITSGHNPGCGTHGFEAVEGWDPITGLGTPNYPKLLKKFLSLP